MRSLLDCQKIIKRYGSTTVLDCEQFNVDAGEIHALLGANGAGKSTLCRIIAGLLQPDAGSMSFHGAEYLPTSKQQAESRGVEIVQQELNLVPTLSVAENLFLTRLPHRGGVIRRDELRSRARRALDRFGLSQIDPDLPVGLLGVGRQQMVEIAAALDRNCRLLILDEPTAALSSGEAGILFQHLRQLRRQGVAIITITHRLDEVVELADRVTVLRDGLHVHTAPISSLTKDSMIEWMSGPQKQGPANFQSHMTSRCVLKVASLTGGMVRDVSFQLFAGQRLGIAGLVGSGRTELIRLIFGADRADSGSVQRDGTAVGNKHRFRHPREAVAAGLAMVTEDRKRHGLLLTQSIRSNSTLNSLGERFSRWGLVRGAQEASVVDEMISALEVKCQSREQAVVTLSGGNQQKVAIARWLVRDAEVFFFDEPTRGIDIAARRRIYQLFDSLAQAGKSLVIVSSDLEELLETCDHIGVMSAGRWTGMFERSSWTREQIMQAAFAGYRGAEEANDG
jgi:ribose transport system ATP-binding protein